MQVQGNTGVNNNNTVGAEANTAAQTQTKALVTADEAKTDVLNLNKNYNSAKDGKIDTLEELNEILTSKRTEEIAALKDIIKKLEDQIAAYEDFMDTYEDKIKECEDNIKEAEKTRKEAEKQLELKQQELDELLSQQKSTQTKYASTKNSVEGQQDDLAEQTKAVQEAAKRHEQNVVSDQEDYIASIKSSYNPETDGEWEDYLEKEMEGYSASSSSANALDKMQSDTKAMQNDLVNSSEELTTLGRNLTNLNERINAVRVEIADLQNTITTATNTITVETANIENLQKTKTEKTASMQGIDDKLKVQKGKLADAEFVANENYSGISQEEWDVVQKNNIDLTEKMSNGEPRYIIATGTHDKAWHIYDMSQDGYAVVRKKAKDGGYDIIKKVNGHINDFTSKAVGDGKITYSMSSNQCSLEQSNHCYYTTSPLSFDLNGDGVKTSGTIITYDIDGDGQLDRINDSADAVLVFDADGDGISGEDGKELFGDNTDLDGDGKKDGYKDGFAALKAFAKKLGLIGDGDSKLDEKDIKILEEQHGFGLKTGGYNSEVQKLSDLGITEINLAETDETTTINDFDGQGNQLMTQAGATFTQNGEVKDYADIWHAKQVDSNEYTKITGSAGSQVAQKTFDKHEVESISIKEESDRILKESKKALEELAKAKRKKADE